MQTRTLSRELALFVLGQCAEREHSSAVEDDLEILLQRALDRQAKLKGEMLALCRELKSSSTDNCRNLSISHAVDVHGCT